MNYFSESVPVIPLNQLSKYLKLWFSRYSEKCPKMFVHLFWKSCQFKKKITILTFKNINSYVPSLEEECESSLCTAALRARNMELQNDMKKLVAVFEKLHTYINLLALPSKHHSLAAAGNSNMFKTFSFCMMLSQDIMYTLCNVYIFLRILYIRMYIMHVLYIKCIPVDNYSK